ncbi:MAG: cupin domain-containing protein [Proteobacteria bacterium]|nr:cupin domain-containing protein [Pseudomonadota bacterium]
MASEELQTRRIVTGHDESGNSIVLFDDRHDYQGRVQVWTTEGSPADNSGHEDEAATRPPRLEAPPQGSMFWLVRFPPLKDLDPERAEEDAARLAAEGAATHSGGQTPMHTTRTIDYMVVLEGEITLILDEGEVTLKKYDTVVQRGTSHHWENRGSEPACLAFVLLDAKELNPPS